LLFNVKRYPPSSKNLSSVVEDAEAVVNAANGMLRHGGGVAAALVKKGGNIIQTESDEYVSKHGKIPDGSVAVTSAGSLPSKYIIHAGM